MGGDVDLDDVFEKLPILQKGKTHPELKMLFDLLAVLFPVPVASPSGVNALDKLAAFLKQHNGGNKFLEKELGGAVSEKDLKLKLQIMTLCGLCEPQASEVGGANNNTNFEKKNL